jgi:hypothetical protein
LLQDRVALITGGGSGMAQTATFMSVIPNGGSDEKVKNQ